MAFSSTPLRQYYISRPCDENGDIDYTAALLFNPPKDSDELYEALKDAFPAVKTHKERVREAVIHFHLQEGAPVGSLSKCAPEDTLLIIHSLLLRLSPCQKLI